MAYKLKVGFPKEVGCHVFLENLVETEAQNLCLLSVRLISY